MMHASNALFVLSSVLCAASVNVGMLIIGRIIMGVAGCVPAVLGGGYIADLMPVEQRGRTLAIWTCGFSLVRSCVVPKVYDSEIITSDRDWQSVGRRRT